MAEAVLQKPLRRVRVEAEYLDFDILSRHQNAPGGP